MKLLLDSQAYLWWLADHAGLSVCARSGIADPANVVVVSAASIWESEIKRSLGRLDAEDADLVGEIAENRFVELSVEARHAAAAARLPRHHDDPFDRLLIAQAQLEGLIRVTRDQAFGDYGIVTLW